VDLFRKCFDFDLAARVQEVGFYPFYRTISSPQEPVVEMDGRKVVMLGSNNYLGLTNHPAVKEAARAALERFGTGCAGSRLLNGTLDIHVELEERLARFLGREAALTFPTGFQVNLGVLSCLLGRRDVAVLDSLDHACILDGARLGFGKVVKFRHNDMGHLEQRLGAVPEDRGVLLVVDGVFSMEGDLCHLPEIVRLKQRFGFRLMVDDAHGLGVFGAHGRGTAEHFGLEAEVDLVMGTFSKSLATVGGFVAGDARVIDFVRHHARSVIFSAALPPASAAAAARALEIVEEEPGRREQLWRNTETMRRELQAMGWDTGLSQSPVIPLHVGDDLAAFRMVQRLHEEGVFVNGVIAPAVPSGQAMLRTSYMATHRQEHLEQALDALRRIGQEVGVL